MGIELARAFVRVFGDLTGLSTDMNRARDLVDRELLNLSGYATSLLSALGVGASVYSMFSEAARAMAEAQGKIAAEKRLDATWNATANAIGRSQEELKLMVREWERVTNFDGTDITNALASALTYTALTKEQLDKVMETAMDVTAVFGGSLRNNVEQIARLLSNPLDPRVGLGSLAQKGYYITPEQRRQMKEFQQAGNLKGAQGVLMDVLSGQEGAARRIAGPVTALKDLKLKVQDLREEVGRKWIEISKKWEETTLQLTTAKLRLLSAITPIVSGLVDLNNSMGGFPIKVLAATAGITLLRKTLLLFGISFQSQMIAIQFAIRQTGFSWTSFVWLVRGGVVALKGVLVSTGIGIALVLIGEALGYVYQLIASNSKATEGLGRIWKTITQTLSGVMSVATELFSYAYAQLSGPMSDLWMNLKDSIYSLGLALNEAFVAVWMEIGPYVITTLKTMIGFIGVVVKLIGMSLAESMKTFASLLHWVALLTTRWSLTWDLLKASAVVGMESLKYTVLTVVASIAAEFMATFAAMGTFAKEILKGNVAGAYQASLAAAASMRATVMSTLGPDDENLKKSVADAIAIKDQMEKELAEKRKKWEADRGLFAKGPGGDSTGKESLAQSLSRPAGRFGFMEYGHAIQDQYIGKDIAQRHLEATQDGVGVLREISTDLKGQKNRTPPPNLGLPE